MQIRLNIGGGSGPELPGYITVDRKTGGEAYPLPAWVTTPNATKMQLTDGSVDEVRVSHVLEHFSHRELTNVVTEWVRVLKPGGVLKIAVPDFDKIVSMYANGTDPLAESYLMGGHSDANDHHGAIFNEDRLRRLMRMAGLVNIRPWTSEVQDCASLPVSLNLMGNKPKPGTEKLDDVAIAMSVPRLGFNETTKATLESIHSLGLQPFMRSGAYWSHCLTDAMEDAVSASKPLILTIDYDTIFDSNDIRSLHRLMHEYPDADVIAATQIARHHNSPLMTIAGPDGKARSGVTRAEVDADLLPVTTVHFGLTMIRASALAKLAKPWFPETPDPRGGWGAGRIDPDVGFWTRCRDAGLKVYQANHVRVGHLELSISWLDSDYNAIEQRLCDYRADGRPPQCL